MLKALLFDFDGLILDTEVPEVTAWQRVFASVGAEFPDWVWKEMIGRSTPENLELPWRVLGEQIGSFDRPKLEAETRQIRLDLIAQETVRPGVISLLDQCDALGVRAAVVSSSNRSWVSNHLARLDIGHRFERYVCGHEGLPSKPNPALYLEALRLMQLEANAAVALEDSPNGTRAAKDAGIYVVAVPNPLTAQMDLSHADLMKMSLEHVELKELLTR